jgi:hypothetical protein
MIATFHSSLRVFTFGFLRGIAHPWLAFCYLAGEYTANLTKQALGPAKRANRTCGITAKRTRQIRHNMFRFPERLEIACQLRPGVGLCSACLYGVAGYS